MCLKHKNVFRMKTAGRLKCLSKFHSIAASNAAIATCNGHGNVNYINGDSVHVYTAQRSSQNDNCIKSSLHFGARNVRDAC